MITKDKDAVFLDLGAEMPIAEMPRELDQVHAIPAPHLEELLVCGYNFDELAILENQHITTGKKHRLLEVEHDHLAVVEVKQLSPQMPQVVRQNHFSDGVRGRRARRQVGSNALHDVSNSLETATMQNSLMRCKKERAGKANAADVCARNSYAVPTKAQRSFESASWSR